MNLLSITDHIYFYVYSCLVKSQSRAQAHSSTAAFMIAIVLFHFVTISGYVSYRYRFEFVFANAKSIVIALTVLLGYAAWTYYLRHKNGERIIKDYANKINEKTAKKIGFLIVIETLLIPFIFAGILILWQKYLI